MSKKTKLEALSNPPIIEAVFEISTTELKESKIEKLSLKEKKFRAQFPKEDKIQLFEGTMTPAKKEAFFNNHQAGFSYESKDEKDILQFRTNGFSYHRLQPYSHWEDFINTALTYWEKYKNLRDDIEVTKLGLRFINVIKLNGENSNKYLKIDLSFPSEIKKPKQLQYRYISEFPDLESIAIVNLIQTENIVLDINIIKNTNLNQNVITKELLKNSFEQMREAKNVVFFKTLTPQALENYR